MLSRGKWGTCQTLGGREGVFHKMLCWDFPDPVIGRNPPERGKRMKNLGDSQSCTWEVVQRLLWLDHIVGVEYGTKRWQCALSSYSACFPLAHLAWHEYLSEYVLWFLGVIKWIKWVQNIPWQNWEKKWNNSFWWTDKYQWGLSSKAATVVFCAIGISLLTKIHNVPVIHGYKGGKCEQDLYVCVVCVYMHIRACV